METRPMPEQDDLDVLAQRLAEIGSNYRKAVQCLRSEPADILARVRAESPVRAYEDPPQDSPLIARILTLLGPTGMYAAVLGDKAVPLRTPSLIWCSRL